jgi:hypothetical protein
MRAKILICLRRRAWHLRHWMERFRRHALISPWRLFVFAPGERHRSRPKSAPRIRDGSGLQLDACCESRHTIRAFAPKTTRPKKHGGLREYEMELARGPLRILLGSSSGRLQVAARKRERQLRGEARAKRQASVEHRADVSKGAGSAAPLSACVLGACLV